MSAMRSGFFRTVTGDLTFRRTAMVLVAIGVVAAATFAVLRNSERGMAIEGEEPNGAVKTVMVRLKNADFIDSRAEITSTRSEIVVANDELEATIGALPGYQRLVHALENFPMAVYEVDDEGEAALKTSGLVESVMENQLMESSPVSPIPSPIEAAMGGSDVAGFTDGTTTYDGSGQKVVIIDSGVNRNHGALAGKVVNELCVSFEGMIAGFLSSNICVGGTVVESDDTVVPGVTSKLYMSSGVGSAAPCSSEYIGCDHGTMVAASAVMPLVDMQPQMAGVPAGTVINSRGVASGASVIAVKAGAYITNSDNEKVFTPDAVSTIYALDEVFTLAKADDKIAAVNLSSGVEIFANSIAECKSATAGMYDMFNDAFGQFKAIGVATFVAAGNSGDGKNQNKVGAYSCAENAVAVASAKNDGTGVAYYSNNGSLTGLLAPGGDVSRITANNNQVTVETIGDVLWMPDGFSNDMMTTTQGTSFASPMAAGAYAVLREKHPTASVNQLVNVLKSTGKPVVDTRAGYTVGAKPLIQVSAALAANIGAADPDDPTDPTVPTNPKPTVPDTDGNTAGAPSTGVGRGAEVTAGENVAEVEGSRGGDAVTIAVIVGISSAVGMTVLAVRRFLK